MVAPENLLLAREVVNRYWKHFLGRGIVEPEDDLRDTNPPSNPELLDALASDFARSGYDLRHLVRTICSSATYGLSSVPIEATLPSGEKRTNLHDRQNFSRFQPRRLPAEVLLDALDQVTGAKTRFQGVLREARAIDLPDESSRSYFLDVFGKPDRSSACACERSGDSTLSQVLHLLNSREVQGKLDSGEGRAALLAKDPRSDREKVRELFLEFVRRIDELHERPEFYNVLTANCTTSVRMMRAPSERIPFDYRMLLNGKADELLYERGALDQSLPFAELKQRARVPRTSGDAAGFSERIRSGDAALVSGAPAAK